ncbi:MAG: hypothetical protein V1797_19945 [Pseudomonadota bacterium]
MFVRRLRPLALALMLAALACLAGAGPALAMGPYGGNGVMDPANPGPYHVDLDQDGVVDWAQNAEQWQMAGNGQFGAWLDADNDGIHDWWQNGDLWQQATGGRFGDWADADGDGICDNFAVRPLDGSGNGYQGGR